MFVFFLKHKLLVGFITILLIGGGYFIVKSQTPSKPLQYVSSAATKQTIVTLISASGQVSGENQLDLKPTVSGAITKVFVKPGDVVTTSTVLLTIDSTDAQRTVRDAVQSVNNARLSVQSAELSLQKVQQPPDALTLIQSQNSVDQAQRALDTLKKGTDPIDLEQAQHAYQIEADKIAISEDEKTPNSIRDAYDAAVPTIKSATLSLQTAFRDVKSTLDTLGQNNLNNSYEYSRLLSATDPNSSSSDNLYHSSQQAYDSLKPKADALTITNQDTTTIDADLLLARTGLASTGLFLQKMDEMLVNIVPSSGMTQATVDSMRSAIRSDRSDVLSKTTTITNAIQTIESAKTSFHAQEVSVEKSRIALDKLKQGADVDDVASAEERLAETKASLAKTKQGATALDLLNAQNAISQRRADLVSAQSRLADAQTTLQSYTVHAPFEGIMATVLVRAGDQASQSTNLGTLLTKAKIVTIPLNEVDISKTSVGQKATLSFDALPDLSIAGSVTQIDTIGTTSQGVVNYNVKVAFLTEDDRVKPGMSASVSIITNTHADVITVPNAAIRQTDGQSTVQILSSEAAPPEVRIVQVGLANDQVTEIVSGVQEGEMVVTRTIDPNIKTAATTPAARQGSTLGIPGVGGTGAGGGFRAGGVTGR